MGSDEPWIWQLGRLLAPYLGYAPVRWPAAVLVLTTSLAERRGLHPAEFLQSLATTPDPAIIESLIAAATVKHTAFGRHLEQLEHLATDAAKYATRTRVWSVGCATGEEPVSIASMLLKAGCHPRIEATDIDARAIATARASRYGRPWRSALVPEGDAFRVRDDITGCIEYRVLALHDLPLASTPKFDYVVCRNVLIYFSREDAAELLARLASYARRAVLVAPTDLAFDIPARLVSSEPAGWLSVRGIAPQKPSRGTRPSPARPFTLPTQAAPPPRPVPATSSPPSRPSGSAPESEQQLMARLDGDPSDALRWFLLGESLVKRGEPSQAASAYRRAIECARDTTEVDGATLQAAAQRRLTKIERD